MRARTLIAGAAAALAAAPVAGAMRWKMATARLRQTLGDSTAGVVFTPDHLAGLPGPVARYFRRVLTPGQPLVRTIELQQDGEFRIGTDGWREMHATQHVSTDPRGFVWDARIAMLPLVSVYVRDGYVRGAGRMKAEAMALIPMLTASASPELNAGALQRYLAECVWYPTALLPREGVRWSAVDDRRATATLSDNGTTVSVQFAFNEKDEIVEFSAPDRCREVNGRYEPTPWGGRCAEYRQHGGMWIPVDCEVEWRLPAGPLPYWRARISNVRYR